MSVSIRLRNIADQLFVLLKALICMLVFLQLASQISFVIVTGLVMLMFLRPAHLNLRYFITALVVHVSGRFLKPADQLFGIAVISVFMRFHSA